MFAKTMSVPQIVGIVIVVCLASLIQSAIGFGYALFAIPVLVWLKVSLPDALVIMVTCSLI